MKPSMLKALKGVADSFGVKAALKSWYDRSEFTRLDQDALLELMRSAQGGSIREAIPVLKPWCSIMSNSSNSLTIDANGNVSTCCYDDKMLNNLGNVYGGGLKEAMNRFTAALLGDLYDLPVCRNSCIGSGQPWSPSVVCLERANKESDWKAQSLSSFPTSCVLEPAAICNYACDGCPANWNDKALADMGRLYDALAEGLPHMNFMAFGLYGEPLLNKALPDFCARCRKIAPKLTMQLLTNGTPLTEDVAHKIVDAGVDIVTIAIHAGPFTENMLKYSKRGANYELVLKNLKRLLEIRDALPSARTSVQVRTVLFNWNDTDDLMNRLRSDVYAAGLNPGVQSPTRSADSLYWVLDVAGPQAPRSSKRFLAGNAEVEALKARGEFSAF